ncbi:MAG TPA: aminotransferase class I/II-fold pyridoxal phosphate-dependent enzyme [Pirellulales bacterium]|jgi:cystathionine beta-lyase/cystathionine gamma-synthase|nr:aminotransferase class I/II-fold pyridoxal phosphate-dependent enzyme [Pirellulales bacterium]
MSNPIDDLCPRPDVLPSQPTAPLATPIWLSSVYQCADPQQADAMLARQTPGYVYSRDGHPNGDLLAERCRELHRAERAIVTSTGMSALALAILSQLKAGDHVIVSDQLYGRTLTLFTAECARFGIVHARANTSDLNATAAAFRPNTKLLVVETITNPLLRVSDLAGLANITHEHGAKLFVDNTFASPAVCRPFDFGADLVMESLTKIMNGHSDAVLGLLCGKAELWERVPSALSSWGLTAAPFECWLAARGLATLHLRMERAAANAQQAAERLATQIAGGPLEAVHYPGLPAHPDHRLAQRQFGSRSGAMVTFTLRGGTSAAERFIAAARSIPFCPSLGELCTTLSHPESTSHRSLTAAQRAELGIFGGTIRLSIGTESPEFVVASIEQGLAGV